MFFYQFLISIAEIETEQKTDLIRFWPNQKVSFLNKMILYVVFFPSVSSAQKNVSK